MRWKQEDERVKNQKPMWQIMREAALEREENEILKIEEEKRSVQQKIRQIVANSNNGHDYYFHDCNGSKLRVQRVQEIQCGLNKVKALFTIGNHMFFIILPVDNIERWELIIEDDRL